MIIAAQSKILTAGTCNLYSLNYIITSLLYKWSEYFLCCCITLVFVCYLQVELLFLFSVIKYLSMKSNDVKIPRLHKSCSFLMHTFVQGFSPWSTASASVILKEITSYNVPVWIKREMADRTLWYKFDCFCHHRLQDTQAS